MLTRHKFTPPIPTGDSATDFRNLCRSISDFFGALEQKNALQIDSAQIRAASGIVFPASQGAASSDAHTLDDYEEGSNNSATVTPQTGSFTTVSASYAYTKIGNRVCINVTVVDTTNNTAAGVIDVNIPFVPAAKVAAAAVRDDSKGVAAVAFNNGGQGQFRFLSLYDGSTYAGGTGRTLYGTAVFYV